MRKKMNVLRHVAIFFLSAIIIIISIFLGGFVEQLRVQHLYNSLSNDEVNYQDLQTELNYMNTLLEYNNITKEECDVIKGNYYTSIVYLDNAREKLMTYANNAKIDEAEFKRLKLRYTDSQINYYILAKEINKKCGGMNIILYFYGDDKNCPYCQDEGVHLTYVKEKLKDKVLIFALNSEQKGPVQLLVQKYDVFGRKLPVLVINGKIYGYKTNDQIFKILNVSSN